MSFIVAGIFAYRRQEDAAEAAVMCCLIGCVELCVYGAMWANV
jgi:biotin transporter BioY